MKICLNEELLKLQTYPTNILSLQNGEKIQTSRIFKYLKFLLFFACKC